MPWVAAQLQAHAQPAQLVHAMALLEEHKIRAFIAMLEGLQAVGIPLPEQGDAKPIEQWPLSQAYAQQDFEALVAAHEDCLAALHAQCFLQAGQP